MVVMWRCPSADKDGLSVYITSDVNCVQAMILYTQVTCSTKRICTECVNMFCMVELLCLCLFDHRSDSIYVSLVRHRLFLSLVWLECLWMTGLLVCVAESVSEWDKLRCVNWECEWLLPKYFKITQGNSTVVAVKTRCKTFTTNLECQKNQENEFLKGGYIAEIHLFAIPNLKMFIRFLKDLIWCESLLKSLKGSLEDHAIRK